jgi:hypothetical protein
MDLVPISDSPSPEPGGEVDEPVADDVVAKRRAEFEALLESAVSDSMDDDDDGPSNDEWGLPTN